MTIIKNFYNGKVFNISYFSFYKDKNLSYVYKLYSSTNENLNYLKQLGSFENKNILVPTGSGDHVFNSLYLGARNVETFDINSIAKNVFDLKETAIKILSWSEFLDFYSSENFFNKGIYLKIRPFLHAETKELFDCVLKNNNFDSPFQNIFEEDKEDLNSRKQLVEKNPYLQNEESYLKLQKILRDNNFCIKHKICPAHLIHRYFDKKDVIIFSNIFNSYYGFEYNTKDFLKNIPKALNPNGVASIDYIYNYLNRISKFLISRKIKKNLTNVETISAGKDNVLITRNLDGLNKN